MIATKPIKEMNAQERRDYKKACQEARAEKWRWRNQHREEAEQRAYKQFNTAWKEIEDLVERRESPEQAVPIAQALSQEARHLVFLWASLQQTRNFPRDILENGGEAVRVAMGMRPAAFRKLIASLYSVGVFLPNLSGEFAWDCLSRTFVDILLYNRETWVEASTDPVYWLTEQLVAHYGYALNEGVLSWVQEQPNP
jgi:hypothetical protein